MAEARLSDCQTSKLIGLIREHPCIWDARCSDYSNRDRAREARLQICREMGDCMNEETLMKKYRSLRTQFGKCLNVYLASKKSGASASEVKLPTWKFFQQLEFLRPCVITRKGKDNMPRQSRDSTSMYEDVSHQYLQTSNKPAAEQQGDCQGNPRHLAWLVVAGDAIHNMADWLAIGAAFAHSITMGLSVSMAVICHELPHELGDLAVLVSTGMTVRKALLLNLLSGLTAFLGLYTGIRLGHAVSPRQWIFVVVAAMFLYIALASLIPELVRYFQLWRNAAMFIVQSAGLLSGFLVMVLLVLVETKVHI